MSIIDLSRAALLRNTALSFCTCFTMGKAPSQILDDHFTPAAPRITEHGPTWAAARLPFLGHTFTGRDMCMQYFELLGSILAFEPVEDTFPSEEGFVVDPEAVDEPVNDLHSTVFYAEQEDKEGVQRGVVTVTAKARFRAVKTGWSWEERFIYRLSEFDENGKIGHWEVWADPLSAWMAVGNDEPGAEEQKTDD